MRTSVLATVRAFSSQRRGAGGCRAGCRAGSPRARTHPTEIAARIQPDLRIQIVHALRVSVSWIHARAGGWEAAHAMEWARLPGRGGLLIRFEKSAARKLKCVYELRS